jgi:beta-glucosidase-like glycosyl hydrolase
MRLYDTIRFPHNLTLAAQGNLEVIYEIAYEIGKQCKAMGVHINFAPVVDINTNPENPIIGDRSFGDNKEHVAACGVAFAQGLQDAGILACAKHFPGHGDTTQNSHLELPKVLRSKEEIFDEDLYPFKVLIDAGVACIMNAHLQVPALDKTRNQPTSLSKKVVTELLQEQLGFQGLVITDGMGMKAVTKHHKPGEAALKALQAGNDIILCPVDVPAAVECIEQALLNGSITHKKLDGHVLKILQVKEQLLLHEQRFVNKEHTLQALKNPDALALKKEAYQNAIAINQNFNLPTLDESTAIVQVGGYLPSAFEKTIRTYHKIPTYHLSSEPQKENLEFVEKKLDEKKVVVFSIFGMEKNFATNYGVADHILQLIHRVQKQNKEVVIILFGTPYALELFENQQKIILAYEDNEDTQEAAAEIIVGKRKPIGILPVKIN